MHERSCQHVTAEPGSEEGWMVSQPAGSSSPRERALLPASSLVGRGRALSVAQTACQHTAQGSSPRVVQR